MRVQRNQADLHQAGQAEAVTGRAQTIEEEDDALSREFLEMRILWRQFHLRTGF